MTNRKSSVQKSKNEVLFTGDEVAELTELVQFTLDSDVVRPPFTGALRTALGKLELLKDDGPGALKAAPSIRAPVRMQ